MSNIAFIATSIDGFISAQDDVHAHRQLIAAEYR
jgi:hypothetical protein